MSKLAGRSLPVVNREIAQTIRRLRSLLLECADAGGTPKVDEYETALGGFDGARPFQLPCEDDAVRRMLPYLHAWSNAPRLTVRSVEDTNLSIRTKNALAVANIATVDDLSKMTDEDLLSLPNFGRKSFNEVRELLGSASQH